MSNRKRYAIKLHNNTVLHFLLRDSPKTIENPTVQISMPQPKNILSIPSPRKHIAIFVNEKEGLVFLVSDETKPERSKERHVFRKAIPIKDLINEMGEAGKQLIDFIKKLGESMTFCELSNLKSFNFLSGVPIFPEYFDDNKRLDKKGEIYDIEHLLFQIRFVKGSDIQPCHLPCLLVKPVLENAAWESYAIVMDTPVPSLFVIIPIEAIKKFIGAMMVVIAPKLFRLIELPFEKEEILKMADEIQKFEGYPFIWTDEQIEYIRTKDINKDTTLI